MKKPIKSIITSSLLAVAFGALSVGSTFALFTSQSQTEINVGSGIVNVESKTTLVSYQSTVEGETIYPITGNSYSNTRIGNSFGLDGNIVTIDKMVPGDVLTLKLSAINKSNVKTKTRLVINHATVGTKTDLYPALDLDFSVSNGNPANLFKWTIHDAVPEANIAEGIELYEDLTVSIAFPDGDNGEILFGDANHDNQYQDAACSIMFSLEAVQGNAATSPIDAINAYLQAEKIIEGQNKTMYDAVQDMAELDYDLSILNYNNVNYVYSLDDDQFVAEGTVSSNYHRYFKVCSEMPGEQTFSIYAADDFSANEGAVALTGVGFDAGDSTGVMSVSYAGLGQGDARTNIIRTNSLATAVTVNAPYDTVNHYGDAASVNIQAVAGNSYHEFGNVAFTEIASGRIVLEEGSNTVQIHLNAKDDNSFAAITIANNGLSAEELPSKITRDQINVQNEKELVVTVRDLVNETVEPVYAYPYSYVEQTETINVGTTEKTVVQNADVETPLGLKVIDSNAHDGEKALAPEAKNDAKETAIEEVIEDNDYVAQISTKFYKTFDAAFADVKNNDTLKVINNCQANGRDSTAYNVSGKNLTIEVKSCVEFDCGNVLNAKFVIGENNAAGTLTFDGTGKLIFTHNTEDTTWGLVTNLGSGNDIKAIVRNLTIESLVANGNLVTKTGNTSSISVESGLFKNIAFANGQIIEGYEAKDTDSDGYFEIVEKDLAAGNIFELTKANNEKIYIADEDVASMLAGESSIVTTGCTLKLLTDYTFSNVIYTSWSGLLYLSGSDVVLDLNSHSLTIDCSPSTYMLNIESSGSLTFMNGYIYTASTGSQKLFDGGYCDENNFHSINVRYGSNVLNPWTGVQMTPVV